jgi:uncharacterized repeat protein (TIGR03803 family)
MGAPFGLALSVEADRENGADCTWGGNPVRVITRWSALALLIALAAILPGSVQAQAFSTIFHFDMSDGSGPTALLQATDGNLYGMTKFGGPGDSLGTTFTITTGGALTTLDDLCSSSTSCTEGTGPVAGWVQADGNLYGTTASGGANLAGTIYKITLSGTQSTVYSFCTLGDCADGLEPIAGLILGSDGDFYGTTTLGGVNRNCINGIARAGCGTIFKLTATGEIKTLYSFCPGGLHGRLLSLLRAGTRHQWEILRGGRTHRRERRRGRHDL